MCDRYWVPLHVTHHTSHVTNVTNVTNHHKTGLDPLCDTILEKSPPQDHHWTLINMIGHNTCCITHHTSHVTSVTNVTNHQKTALDPLCDTILEMSQPQHHHGTVISMTGYIPCHITPHTSHVTNVTNVKNHQ